MGQSEFSFRDNGLFQREDWLLTYDSERRLGNIRHGKTSQDSDSILEFRYEKVGYGWESVSSEAMGYE